MLLKELQKTDPCVTAIEFYLAQQNFDAVKCCKCELVQSVIST